MAAATILWRKEGLYLRQSDHMTPKPTKQPVLVMLDAPDIKDLKDVAAVDAISVSAVARKLIRDGLRNLPKAA